MTSTGIARCPVNLPSCLLTLRWRWFVAVWLFVVRALEEVELKHASQDIRTPTQGQRRSAQKF